MTVYSRSDKDLNFLLLLISLFHSFLLLFCILLLIGKKLSPSLAFEECMMCKITGMQVRLKAPFASSGQEYVMILKSLLPSLGVLRR